MVEMSHTAVDPGTVVVHLHHTPSTPPAVVRPRGLVALDISQLVAGQSGPAGRYNLALRAELELRAGRGVSRAPVRWEEPGTNTEGTEEMVNCQAGETCSRTEVRGEVRGEERLTTKYQCVDQTPDTL